MRISEFRLQGSNSRDSSLQRIVHDLGMLINSLNSISFKFVPRQCNVVADRLAKGALFQIGNVNSSSLQWEVRFDQTKIWKIDILHIYIVLFIYSCAFLSYRLGFSHV